MTVSEVINFFAESIQGAMYVVFGFIFEVLRVLFFNQNFLDAPIGPAIVALLLWLAALWALGCVLFGGVLVLEHLGKYIISKDYREKIKREKRLVQELKTEMQLDEEERGLTRGLPDWLKIVIALVIVMLFLNILTRLLSWLEIFFYG